MAIRRRATTETTQKQADGTVAATTTARFFDFISSHRWTGHKNYDSMIGIASFLILVCLVAECTSPTGYGPERSTQPTLVSVHKSNDVFVESDFFLWPRQTRYFCFDCL